MCVEFLFVLVLFRNREDGFSKVQRFADGLVSCCCDNASAGSEAFCEIAILSWVEFEVFVLLVERGEQHTVECLFEIDEYVRSGRMFFVEEFFADEWSDVSVVVAADDSWFVVGHHDSVRHTCKYCA